MMRTIFLVGYMCSGKTTLGRELAELMGMDFFDLDEMIEKQAEMPAIEILARLGEPCFREMEREALRRVAGQAAVVADDEILPHVIEALGRRSPYYAQAQLHFDATDIETAEQTRITAGRLLSVLSDQL